MTEVKVYPERPEVSTHRLIDKYEKDEGPILIAVGGVHGNEPSGIYAMESFFRNLEKQPVELKASVYGIKGNLKALEKKRRFIDRDLNRLWVFDEHGNWKFEEESFAEKDEFREMLHFFREIFFHARDREVILVDLHTTSSNSLPFLLLRNSLFNRKLVKNIPVPTVLGVEAYIRGTLMNYMDLMGGRSLTFEAGNHLDPAAPKKHESLIWSLLYTSGGLSPDHHDFLEPHLDYLFQTARDMQVVFETVFRYGIKTNENFRMKAGYSNFDEVMLHEVVAYNDQGEVRAPIQGHIFMPLYQEQGEDGFFIIEPV